jgi:hypothetical protein
MEAERAGAGQLLEYLKTLKAPVDEEVSSEEEVSIEEKMSIEEKVPVEGKVQAPIED